MREYTVTSVDSLFTTQQERDEANLKKIYDIPISEIDDFPEHPYQVNDDEDMDRLVESIKERGIITPASTQQQNTSQTVYITETGKKYHSRSSCSGLSRAKAIYTSTLQNAKNRGLGPCSKCY